MPSKNNLKMEAQLKKINLGKRRKVGDTFVATTKKMTKNRQAGNTYTYEVLRSNDIKTFVKGKRSYVCQVIGMVELRTGMYYWSDSLGILRYWQFSYLVKIIEN